MQEELWRKPARYLRQAEGTYMIIKDTASFMQVRHESTKFSALLQLCNDFSQGSCSGCMTDLCPSPSW